MPVDPTRAPVGFSRDLSAQEAAWLRCVQGMIDAGGEAVRPLAGTAAGREPLGRGAGGDVTVRIDEAAEQAMLAVLADSAPAPYRLVAEEAGIIESQPGARWHVVVDPVDGSLNAKRGLGVYSGVVAVADGPRLGDVCVGLIADYARDDTFAAVRGAGVRFAERTAASALGGQIEVVLFDAGKPGNQRLGLGDLLELAPDSGVEMRVRLLGSQALCLCYLASGAADVLFSAVNARAVDIAAGLLILTESGGGVASLSDTPMDDRPLDLERRGPFVAWRAGVDGEAVTAAARRIVARL
jgi:myo-inositol-1(or 4)-monophosphatase